LTLIFDYFDKNFFDKEKNMTFLCFAESSLWIICNENSQLVFEQCLSIYICEHPCYVLISFSTLVYPVYSLDFYSVIAWQQCGSL